MARVIVSENADVDANDILAYLTREAGARTARKFAAKLDALYDKLGDFPGIGAPRPLFGPDVRISGVPPYVVIYEYAGGAVTIFARPGRAPRAFHAGP